jgi:hypothetical protein
LNRKGNTPSELRYTGHTFSDNRHGLIVGAVAINANSYSEREAVKTMIKDAHRALIDDEREITLGADTG